MKVIITKYALSSGVTIIEGHERTGTRTRMLEEVVASGTFSSYFHGQEWHASQEAAAARVHEMFEKRRRSLIKQLASLAKKRQAALDAISAAKLD